MHSHIIVTPEFKSSEWLCVPGKCLSFYEPQFPLGEVAGRAEFRGTKEGGWGADPLLLDKSQAPWALVLL